MASTYEPIATYTASGNPNSYTFSSIPATYTDLVLVMSYSHSGNGASTLLRFNGDTGSNYSDTYLFGTSSAGSSRDTSISAFRVGAFSSGTGSSVRRTTIVSLFNYSNSTTYKTGLSRDSQGADEVGAAVGLWRNTAAINSITVYIGASATIDTGSTFTLYGIKAA
jgi:hypothetical protein